MSNNSSPARIGRPPGADRDKTKAALLEAALQAFGERGFDGASIREVAAAAGVGHNLVRHYFGSKEDLWRAAVGYGLEPAAARIAEMFDLREARPLRPTLRAAVELLMSEAVANPDAFRLFFAEALRGGPRFDQIYDDVLEPIAAALFEYVQVSDEIPSDVDVRVLGIFVFGAAFSPFTFVGFSSRLGIAPPQPGESLDDSLEQLIDLIIAGVSHIES